MIPKVRVGDIVIIAVGMCKHERGEVSRYPENLENPYDFYVKFDDGAELLYKHEEVYKVGTSV